MFSLIVVLCLSGTCEETVVDTQQPLGDCFTRMEDIQASNRDLSAYCVLEE